MTREKAIKALKWFKEYNEEDYCGGDRIQDEHGDWFYRITEQDFEAFDMAIKALEQEPISDILEDIYFDIEKEYEDCVIGKLDDDDDIMNPCFRQITDIYGVLDIIGKYIDKYKPGSEEEDGNDD